MDTIDEKVALCALNKVFGYHPRLALELMEKAGSAGALFSGTPPPCPKHPELTEQLREDSLEWAVKELERVRAGGFRFVALPEEDYPAALRECADPPLGLYLNGSTSPAEIFGLRPMVAVVGTRDLSPYGKEWCRKLVLALGQARIPPCIVSGLAFGADGIAHATALECGLPTVGVMATGIEQIYPYQHQSLAASMVGTPGCGLVTDYPLGTAPVALNFMRRNRIIAGLSMAVIVVESRTRGGSLMTAKYACDYARCVYALPGRADDVRSAGCNSLIREQMAEIITTPEDLVGRLGLGPRPRPAGGSWRGGAPEDRLRTALERRFGSSDGRPDTGATSAARPSAGTSAHQAVAVGLAIRENRGVTAEGLSALLRLPIAEVLSAIGLLEAAGFVTTDLLRRCTLAPAWT